MTVASLCETETMIYSGIRMLQGENVYLFSVVKLSNFMTCQLIANPVI